MVRPIRAWRRSGMSPFLQTLENEVQLACLAFLAVVYAVRLAWLLRFRSTRERGPGLTPNFR